MNLAHLSSAAMLLSGLAGVVIPARVGEALELPASSSRSSTEIRAGLGGGYAALGGWALATGSPAAQIAVGAAWLGAGAGRCLGLAVDRPRTNRDFWLYLAAELGLGTAGVICAVRSRRAA